jgi:hypothetical protein
MAAAVMAAATSKPICRSQYPNAAQIERGARPVTSRKLVLFAVLIAEIFSAVSAEEKAMNSKDNPPKLHV